MHSMTCNHIQHKPGLHPCIYILYVMYIIPYCPVLGVYIYSYSLSIAFVGWCYISLSFDARPEIRQRHLELLFGYELWSWIIIGAIIVCIVAYIFVVTCCKKHCNLRTRKTTSTVRE